eukprot:m.254084 g.254084  ORF g.254084 m.254084 type:complete len:423 (+) comp19140_c2_seq3:906-2174(+)
MPATALRTPRLRANTSKNKKATQQLNKIEPKNKRKTPLSERAVGISKKRKTSGLRVTGDVIVFALCSRYLLLVSLLDARKAHLGVVAAVAGLEVGAEMVADAFEGGASADGEASDVPRGCQDKEQKEDSLNDSSSDYSSESDSDDDEVEATEGLTTLTKFFSGAGFVVPRMVVYGGVGVGRSDSTRAVDTFRQAGCAHVTLCTVLPTGPGELRAACDVLIIPGGRAQEVVRGLGHAQREAIRAFVRTWGGRYVGVCAGALIGGRDEHAFLNLLPVRSRRPKWEQKRSTRLRGTVSLDISNASHALGKHLHGPSSEGLNPLAGDEPLQCWYHNGPLWSTQQPAFRSGTVHSLASITDFTLQGTNSKLRGKLQQLHGSAAFIHGKCGEGNVVLCGPHVDCALGRHAHSVHRLFLLLVCAPLMPT